MNQYYYEDQVYTVDKKGSVKFGLVVENEVSVINIFPSLLNFPDFIFNLNGLSNFSPFLSIKLILLRSCSRKWFLFSRFPAMASMKIIPSRKNFYEKESWGLVKRFFCKLVNSLHWLNVSLHFDRLCGIQRERMKLLRKEM